MKPIIYIRASLAEQDEVLAAKKYFEVVEQRTYIKSNYLVIPRYSALPFYKELEKDVEYLGSKLINSFNMHNYVANIKNWYFDFKQITPKTWFALDKISDNDGPFILKGSTNSRKFNWNTHMFAENKRKAIDIACNLSNDGLIGDQDIVIRQYIPLYKLDQGLNGLPISEEYRFFILNKKVISSGFYWSNYYDDLENKPDVNSVPQSLISTIIKAVDDKINFYVFDVARTQDNRWILIELNDGQQSGLSMIDPEEFYFNLRNTINAYF